MSVRMMMQGRKPAAGGGGYADVVDATSPAYFWPLQGDLVASHGGVNLTDQSTTGVTFVAGPGAGVSDEAADEAAMSLLASGVNANANTTAWSYGGWFRIDDLLSNADNGIIGNWNGQGSMLYVLNATQVRVYVEGATTVYTHGLSGGSWHHWIVTMNASDNKVRIYVDGVLVHTSTAFATAALGSCSALRIGSYNTNSATWRPDMAAAWCGWWVNKTLSLAEIEALAGV